MDNLIVLLGFEPLYKVVPATPEEEDSKEVANIERAEDSDDFIDFDEPNITRTRRILIHEMIRVTCRI